jgi:hypothetical protein
MSELGGDGDELYGQEPFEEEEGTELTYSVYNVEDDSAEEASDEDPEGGEEGAM